MATSATQPLIIHATPRRPGAIAIIQLHGESQQLLQELTGVSDWPLHRIRLVRFADIDSGLAVRLSAIVTQLMPHGGPRVMQRLTDRLMDLEAIIAPDSIGQSLTQAFPEASDEVEELMLQALAKAESPLAIDQLLDQPARWRDFTAAGAALTTADTERAHRLNRLIVPPLVVVAGPPNVGKSTLSNALIGRTMSITADRPGTTRDYVAGRIDLNGLVVDWHDTPGIRTSDDPIEQHAIELSEALIRNADLLIAMRDVQTTNGSPKLPRKPDLRVLNKSDLGPVSAALHRNAMAISAKTGAGLKELVAAIRDALVPGQDLASSRPWLFDPRLVSSAIEPQ